MRAVWTPEAARDRADIFDYLEERNPAAARRIDTLFREAANGLADYPLMGHEGELSGTRELIPHRSYRLVHEVREDAVWILVLIHAARRWPPLRD